MPSRRRFVALVGALALLGGAAGCNGDGAGSASPTTVAGRDSGVATDTSEVAALTLTVVARHPHDPAAFTEGFAFGADGTLFESLGLEGHSSVRRVDAATGVVESEAALPAAQFGEGLAIGPDGLVQLTWKDGVAHRWDPESLVAEGTLPYEGEGWGLTYDGAGFVQSDGSPRLTRRDAATFEPTGSIDVARDGRPVDELNELEWVDGTIWANVWHSDEIMRIDPATGQVTGVLDASSLWNDPSRTSEMTLNGIAHRPGDPPDRLWLTGKNWPEVFEVEVSGS